MIENDVKEHGHAEAVPLRQASGQQVHRTSHQNTLPRCTKETQPKERQVCVLRKATTCP